MSNIPKEIFLRRIYADILSGYTKCQIQGKTAYIQHFSPKEQGLLDDEHIKFFNRAIEKGLITEEERLAKLEKTKEWTSEDEKKLSDSLIYLKGLAHTKGTLMLPSQIKTINEEMEEAEKTYRELKDKRSSSIGLVAESFANKKLNEIYIFSSLFKDKEFCIPFFSEEDFDELDDIELDSVASLYNECMKDTNNKSIKRIALQPFFCNSFYLCEDNIYNFYGKAICLLTYYQSELASYGRYFKHILSQANKPDEEIAADPDKLIDWYNGNKNSEEVLSKSGANVGVIGATKDDVEKIAGKDKAFSIYDYAKQKQDTDKEGENAANGSGEENLVKPAAPAKLSMEQLMALG